MHKAGQHIGYSPGADRIKEAFDEISAAVQARGGDARVESDMLRKSRITIRFGTLNNCLFDRRTLPAPSAWRTPPSPTGTQVRFTNAAAPTDAATA